MQDNNEELNNSEEEEIANTNEGNSSEEVTNVELEEEIKQDSSSEIQKAKKHGHLNREEYKEKYGTEEGYKEPEQFNKFGELYPEFQEQLKGINKKLEKKEKETEALVKYIATVREKERENARNELARALQEAKQQGDGEAVQSLTREQTKMEYQEAQERANLEADKIRSTEEQFQANNPWYGTDKAKTVRAMEIDKEIRAGMYEHILPRPQTYEQLAKQIELIANKEFGLDTPRQTIQNRSGPNISQSDSNTVRSKVNSSSREFQTLPNDQKLVYEATRRMLDKSGYKYTQEEFLTKLKDDGVI